MAINELKDGIDSLVDEATKEPNQVKKEPNPKTLRIKNASDPNAKKVKLGQAEARESQFAKKYPDRFAELVEKTDKNRLSLPKTADNMDKIARIVGVDIPEPQVKTQKTLNTPNQATPNQTTPNQATPKQGITINPDDLPDEVDVLFQKAESKDPDAIKDLKNYIDDLDFDYKNGNYTPDEYKNKLSYARKLLDESTLGLEYYDEIQEQIDDYLGDVEYEQKATTGYKNHNIRPDDFKQFSQNIQKYMPSNGEGNTQASQAVTALNKLIYKWFNDGDTYSNTNPNVRGWANDLSSYANWLAKYVPQAQQILDEYENAGSEQAYANLLFDLADVVLNPNTLASLSAKQKTGSIYDERGNYKWLDDDEIGESKYQDLIYDINNTPYGYFDTFLENFIDENVSENEKIDDDEIGNLWSSYLDELFSQYGYEPSAAKEWFFNSYKNESLLSKLYEEFRQNLVRKTGDENLEY